MHLRHKAPARLPVVSVAEPLVSPTVVSVPALSSKPRVLGPRTFRSSAIGRLFERRSSGVVHGSGVSTEAGTKSVSGHAMPKVLEMIGGELVVSKPSCTPPAELGSGSRSESTNRASSKSGAGSGGISVDDGCPPLVHKSRLMYRVPQKAAAPAMSNLKLGASPSCNNAFDNLRDRVLLPPKPAAFVAINHWAALMVVPDPSAVLNNHMLGDLPTCSIFFDNPCDRVFSPPIPAAFGAVNPRLPSLVAPDPGPVVVLDNHTLGDSPSLCALPGISSNRVSFSRRSVAVVVPDARSDGFYNRNLGDHRTLLVKPAICLVRSNTLVANGFKYHAISSDSCPTQTSVSHTINTVRRVDGCFGTYSSATGVRRSKSPDSGLDYKHGTD